MFAFLFGRKPAVSYDIVCRGSYYVVRRTYANGNVKTDRLGSGRASSTLRTAVNGRFFG